APQARRPLRAPPAARGSPIREPARADALGEPGHRLPQAGHGGGRDGGAGEALPAGRAPRGGAEGAEEPALTCAAGSSRNVLDLTFLPGPCLARCAAAAHLARGG